MDTLKLTRGNFCTLLGASVLAACGPKSNGTAQSNNSAKPMISASGETTLRRANGAEPGSLDPDYAQAVNEIAIIGEMLMGLTTEDANGRPMPGVAERWDTSADGLVWTFYLRDLQWSDGQPLTAQDFLYSWRRILDPKTAAAYASILYLFKNAAAVNAGKMPPEQLGARAIDDKTIELTLENPAPYLLELMMHQTAYPVPRAAIEAHPKDWTQPGHYVSNGPYILSEWIPNDHITLVKNPHFYDAANVKIDKIIFYPISDPDAGLKRFRAGELDTLDSFPMSQIGWVKKNMADMLEIAPYLATGFYAINTAKKPFDDIRIRQALNLAYDRDTIAYKILPLGEPSSYSIVPPGIANYPQGVELPFKSTPYADRVKRAQDLMRQAGYGPDHHLKLTFSTYTSEDAKRTASAAQQMWAAIYVDMDIRQLEFKAFLANAQAGDFDVKAGGWTADYNDARNFLFLAMSGNELNDARYKNPAFDALIHQSDHEQDLEKRGQILAKAETMLLNDAPWIPTRFQVTSNLVRPYVKGWVPNVTDVHRTRWLSLDAGTTPKP